MNPDYTLKVLPSCLKDGDHFHAIWGKQDTVTPLNSAMGLLRKHGVPVDIIDKCGHSPMCESPKEFAMHLSDLLVSRQPMKLKLLA